MLTNQSPRAIAGKSPPNPLLRQAQDGTLRWFPFGAWERGKGLTTKYTKYTKKTKRTFRDFRVFLG
jgi:hypothetical protein